MTNQRRTLYRACDDKSREQSDKSKDLHVDCTSVTRSCEGLLSEENRRYYSCVSKIQSVAGPV